MSAQYDYESLNWESTLEEEVFAMAQDPDEPEYWFGAVAQWLDEEEEPGKEYLALVARINTDNYYPYEFGYDENDERSDWDKAEDMLNSIYTSDIYEEFGWYATREEARDAVLAEIGHVYNLFEPGR